MRTLAVVAAVLGCALPSLGAGATRVGDVDAHSANGRYQAEVRRGELAIYEPRKGEERRKQWSGRHTCDGPAAHALTDDGSVFVHVGADSRAKPPLVEVIRRGLRSAALDAPTLEIEPHAREGTTWIDLDLGDNVLRLRREGAANAAQDFLDLLGRDARVRTIDLARGELALSWSRPISAEMRVEPALDPQAPAGEPVYVARAHVAALQREGDLVQLEVHGNFPTPDWKLAGFEIERGATVDELVLRPRALPGSGVSAAVLRPFTAIARIGGLAPGRYRGRLDGRAGSPALEKGSREGSFVFEVVERDLVVSLHRSGGIAAISQAVRLYADGRSLVVTAANAPERVALAPFEAARALEHAVAALPDAQETRPATPGADLMTYTIVWQGADRPRRIVRDDMTLEEPFRALAQALSELAAPRAKAPEIPRYHIDAAASSLILKTKSGGLFSAFGHDHAIGAKTFSGFVELERGRLDAARLELTVDAASLAVVDRDSQDDAPAIEKEMRTSVLETARYPTIIFTSTKVAVTELGPTASKIALTGELVLHGKTRALTIPAHISLDGDVLHAAGSVKLRQTDWNIRPVSAAGGTIKVADEIELSFDVTARR